jgi:hypothetical protein
VRNFLDLHPLHAVAELLAIDLVTVAQEVGRRGVVRERVHDLLGGPEGGRVLGDVEVDDAAAMVGKHDEDEQLGGAVPEQTRIEPRAAQADVPGGCPRSPTAERRFSRALALYAR